MSDRERVILVVDDDPSMAKSVQLNLQLLGYSAPDCLTDGQEAIDYCRQHSVDLVLLNLSMPGVDGLAAAQTLYRELKIPVVILSAHHDDHLIDSAAEIGVSFYEIKPIDQERLGRTIRMAIKKHDELSELENDRRRLELALEERKRISKAVGILMKFHRFSEDKAYRHLQRSSQVEKVRMGVVADKVIDAHAVLTQIVGDERR